jgi:hypothetical protein
MALSCAGSSTVPSVTTTEQLTEKLATAHLSILADRMDAGTLRGVADGQVPARIFALPHATSGTLNVWDDARTAAREFWERASDDGRVSDDVRSCCAANAKALVN